MYCKNYAICERQSEVESGTVRAVSESNFYGHFSGPTISMRSLQRVCENVHYEKKAYMGFNFLLYQK